MSKGKAKDCFRHLWKHNRSSIYIALDNLNLDFTTDEIQFIVSNWFHGWSLFYISEELKRDIDEVAVMIFCLAERTKGLLLPRDRGIYVSKEKEIPGVINRKLLLFLEMNPNGYSAFQDFNRVDFIWDEREVLRFEDYWNDRLSIEDISKKLNRNKVDVALLILDRSRKGFIKSREGGLKGRLEIDIKENVRKKDRKKSHAS